MALERDYILFYGPKEIEEDGVRIRNKVLQPCGCWSAETWRAPMNYNQSTRAFEPGTTFAWQHDTGQCRIHAAKVAVLQWQLGVRVAERRALETGADPAAAQQAFVNRLGDGAQRLYADTERVLAEACELDEELHALGAAIPRKLLNK